MSFPFGNLGSACYHLRIARRYATCIGAGQAGQASLEKVKFINSFEVFGKEAE